MRLRGNDVAKPVTGMQRRSTVGEPALKTLGRTRTWARPDLDLKVMLPARLSYFFGFLTVVTVESLPPLRAGAAPRGLLCLAGATASTSISSAI